MRQWNEAEGLCTREDLRCRFLTGAEAEGSSNSLVRIAWEAVVAGAKESAPTGIAVVKMNTFKMK